MPATIIMGGQWGDEGKGKLTDAEKVLREAARLDPADQQIRAHLQILESALKRSSK